MGRRAAAEVDPNVEAAQPPEEAGGENTASLFDGSSDARVRVFRRDDRTQKMVTHGYFPPSVSEEEIAAQFGGGHYRAQLVIPDPASGLPKVKRSRDFDIPGAYRPPNKLNTFEDAGPHGSANGSAPAGGVAQSNLPMVGGGDDLMQVLKAGIINTLLEMMKSTKEMRGNGGPDPMLVELMRTQAATQSKMMEFMLTLATKDNGTGNERREIVAEMLQMKELFAAPASGAVPTNPMEMFNNMLDTFKSFRDAAADVAPQGGSGDPIMDSIPKLVEVVAEQHAMNKQQRAAHPPSSSAVTPTVQTLPMPDVPLWKQILRQQGARMVASAVAQHDPDIIAGTAILFAPPNVKAALTEFFHREESEVAADILVEVPAMAAHTEWLSEFVNAAQFRLFPDEFPEDGTEDKESEPTNDPA